MTSVLLPKGGVTVYDEAEKGTLEVPSGPLTVETFGLVNGKVEESKPSTVLPSGVPVSSSVATKPPAQKKKVSKWILWTLWFNTYRCVSAIMSTSRISDFVSNRKLFTFVVTLNGLGLVFAASGHYSYAERWTGAMVLGNLNFAILMRNEIFGRFLYLFVNTCFAKVTIALS